IPLPPLDVSAAFGRPRVREESAEFSRAAASNSKRTSTFFSQAALLGCALAAIEATADDASGSEPLGRSSPETAPAGTRAQLRSKRVRGASSFPCRFPRSEARKGSRTSAPERAICGDVADRFKSLPLPDNPNLAAWASALNDAGHWAQVYDSGWRLVFATDES